MFQRRTEQNYLEKIIPNGVNSEECETGGEGGHFWRGLPCEGCLLEPLLELGFVGTHVATSAQS